ncbi:Sulfatase [Phytophthora megakarya]|uniref:Sulfatase n=1 Tax=Phytophthora megakarya TaxID=4795 RepID=A0A225VS51_9STRA|nr:Sulfatase [Phytophthora megakarya]
MSGSVLVITAVVFATVRTKPTYQPGTQRTWFQILDLKYAEFALEEDFESTNEDVIDKLYGSLIYNKFIYQNIFKAVVVLFALVFISMAVVALRCACSPLVAYSAMNATLNEILGHVLQATSTFSISPWVKAFIHLTEKHQLFGGNSLYRLTTEIHDELAFDVDITNDNSPNVLVIDIESFQYQDSHYLVGEMDPHNLEKGTSILHHWVSYTLRELGSISSIPWFGERVILATTQAAKCRLGMVINVYAMSK